MFSLAQWEFENDQASLQSQENEALMREAHVVALTALNLLAQVF